MRLQGIGTEFYGKKNYNQINKSYITTKWFVLFLLPIFPLKSYRIIRGNVLTKNYVVYQSWQEQYKILETIKLRDNIKQVLYTYFKVYGGLTLFLSSFFLLRIDERFVLVPFSILVIFLIWFVINEIRRGGLQ